LLAEDNPINRKLAVTLLQMAGYRVDTVENGEQAVQAVQQNRYSLVLMDVQMPEMDGLEATGKIRSLPDENRCTPIIAMTAHAMKGDRERCLQAGMDDYVTKPLRPDELFKMIARWVHPESTVELSAERQNASRGPGWLQPADQLSCSGEDLALLRGFSLAGTALESVDLDDAEGEAGLPMAPANVSGQNGNGHPEANTTTRPAATGTDWNSTHGLTCFCSAPACSQSEAGAPLDLTACLPRFGGEVDFFLQMLDEFVDHLPARIVELQAALAAGEALAVQGLAHNLKGVAANFEASAIRSLAHQLEQQARKGDLSTARSLIDKIAGETPRLVAYRDQLVGADTIHFGGDYGPDSRRR
jgi:CheY-like chemotaxis protein